MKTTVDHNYVPDTVMHDIAQIRFLCIISLISQEGRPKSVSINQLTKKSCKYIFQCIHQLFLLLQLYTMSVHLLLPCMKTASTFLTIQSQEVKLTQEK